MLAVLELLELSQFALISSEIYNKAMQKERGSALVIAVLLVSAIGAIAFGFGRIFLAGLFNMTISSDGIYAYYSAESGMEEAFLRYRYDMNAEVPFNTWTLGQDRVFSSDLTGDDIDKGALDQGISKSTSALVSNRASQIYDLRMGYLGTNGAPFWGDDPFPSSGGDQRLQEDDIKAANYGDSNKALTVSKDEAVKIGLSGLDLSKAGNDLVIYAKMSDPSGDPPLASKAIIEAKLIVDLYGNGTQMNEYKTIISQAPGASCTLLGRTSVADNTACVTELIQADQVIGGGSSYFIWKKENLLALWRSSIGLSAFSPSTKATLFLKPLFYEAKLGIVTSGCQNGVVFCYEPTKSGIITGPATYVSSTGYYGGVSRTLAANIDRQSGTLYDLFDYVIYSNE